MEFIKASLSMEYDKVMALLNGIMVKFFKESGKMELKMVMVFGNRHGEITTKEDGNSTGSTAKASINIRSVHIVATSSNF
jgi:hypothetical protein